MKRTALLLLLALPVGACHKDGTDGEGANADEYFYDCENAKKPDGLTVFATDEAYRTFLDKLAAGAPKKDDAQAARLLTPMAGATLSIASPPGFTLTGPMTLGPTPGLPSPGAPKHRRSRWTWVKDLFSLEGKAWAHCPNVTGSLYLLQIKEQGKEEAAYSALASVQSFMPDATVWKTKMTPLQGKMVTVTVARGVFSTGEIQLGPFVPTQDLTLTVGP
jgi:hypothetical protein